MRKLLQQALNALEYHTQQTLPIHNTELAIDALRAALAAPMPEPVAFVDGDEAHRKIIWSKCVASFDYEIGAPLYAAPPAAPAVPLTDGMVAHLEQQAFASTNYSPERPLYQHWFRVGVRAGYGIAAAPAPVVPLTDEQKQRIHNETGAGHSLFCLVESYFRGIGGGNG